MDTEREALAALEELRRRVHRPVPGPPARVDIGAAVRAELDRQAAERAAAEKVIEEARWLMPAPCTFCGYAGSNGGQRNHDTGKAEPWVWQTSRGPACSECWNEAHPLGETEVSDDEHRARVLRELLGETAKGWMDGHLLDRIGSAFGWFYATPGARASDRSRFAFVDVAALAARLEPPGPDYRVADPCPQCGMTSRWLEVPAREESTRDADGRITSWWPAGWRCGGCGYDDRKVRQSRVAQWRQDNADMVHRAPVPELPPHPLCEAQLWPTEIGP